MSTPAALSVIEETINDINVNPWVATSTNTKSGVNPRSTPYERPPSSWKSTSRPNYSTSRSSSSSENLHVVTEEVATVPEYGLVQEKTIPLNKSGSKTLLLGVDPNEGLIPSAWIVKKGTLLGLKFTTVTFMELMNRLPNIIECSERRQRVNFDLLDYGVSIQINIDGFFDDG